MAGRIRTERSGDACPQPVASRFAPPLGQLRRRACTRGLACVECRASCFCAPQKREHLTRLVSWTDAYGLRLTALSVRPQRDKIPGFHAVPCSLLPAFAVRRVPLRCCMPALVAGAVARGSPVQLERCSTASCSGRASNASKLLGPAPATIICFCKATLCDGTW